jgi:succinoglycan biosynthesis transport protein ExoP
VNPPQLTHGQSAPAARPRPEAGENPVLILHRLLRGRYWLAILLAGVLGPIGAVIGYKALPPKYESQAAIRIAPVLPKILYENEENAMIPMFDAYVGTQMSLIGSPRVRNMAMESPAWRENGGGVGPEAVQEFTENLAVSRPKDSQIITVSYTDSNPKRAQAAAKAVVEAFLTVYAEQDSNTGNQRLRVLEERAGALNNEIKGLQDQIFVIANEYGSDALDTVYEHKVQELQKIETELKSAELQLANAEARAGSDEPEAEPDLTIEQIAMSDRMMQQLVAERSRVRLEMEALAEKYTNPEKRPEYQRLKMELELKEDEIQRYAQAYRQMPQQSMPVIAAPVDGSVPMIFPSPLNPEEAKERVERIRALHEEAREATLQLGRQNLKIKNLQTQLAAAQENLKQVNNRIEQLNLEGGIGGRITPISEAELPTTPVNAHKFKQFGVLGGLAGAGLGVGIVLLLGLLNPRIRYIADAKDQQPQLLGALPELPEKLIDPAEAMVAAQCVHQIRMMLQPRDRTERGRALTVSGATAGTGKTSLTIALGLSFAAAGTRTLIIDGDIIGRGMTRRARDVGRSGLAGLLDGPDGIELESPESAAREVGNGNGGLDLDPSHGEEAPAGLLDALRGKPVEHCLAYVGVPNLSILPACGGEDGTMNVMSRSAMTALIDRLRDSYEMILIDSGPVPGPTDSSIMAASTDGVVMVASRGEQLSVMRQAVQHLELIQAPLVGLVFNRARTRDFERSAHSSVSSSSRSGYSSTSRTAGLTEQDCSDSAFARFGPLAQAVWVMSGIAPAATAEPGVQKAV